MSFVIPLRDEQAANAARFGAKAARLAALGHAGLPTPGGFCVDAQAYRLQLAHLGLEDAARGVFAAPERPQARRHALAVKLNLMQQPIASPVLEELLAIRESVVRSSALVEDKAGASFAGQFQSYLGLETEEDFLTAVRACWASLWSTRVLRYMAANQVDPSAMALIIQPLVQARCAGGGLSRTADGDMVVNAAAGPGSSVAQGEVVPDRYVLERSGALKESTVGTNYRSMSGKHGRRAVSRLLAAPALDAGQIAELGLLMRKAEALFGHPVEIEWALDDAGIKLLQARPLSMAEAPVPDEIWLKHPRLSGHPGGAGWGTGRARIVSCECALERVAPGDVLVTTVAGPALSDVFHRVAGIVAELGGSTSHLASLARERGIPVVLGAMDATRRIPDGAMVAVDGVAGVVRWMRA